MKRSAVIGILSAAFAVMLSAGVRSSFGLFQLPLVETIAEGRRETFSLAIAVNSIIYGLPIAGILANRIGSRTVLAGGGVLYIIGMFMLARAESVSGLFTSMGVLIGLALSATTYVVVLGAVAQIVPEERRSQSFGIITAAGSSGMFVIPPIAEYLIQTIGWRSTIMILGALSSLILLLAFGLPRGETIDSSSDDHERFVDVLTRAGKNGNYWLLLAGFFVCGFHVAFVGTHLPAHLSDVGFGQLAGVSLSLIGVFNLIGSYLFGWLGDRYRKKYLLSFLYGARAVVIALFVFLPVSAVTVWGFASAIGFLWLATVPLTSGSVATIFGTRYLATLYGFVFFSHQVGAFLGVWLGGRIHDAQETYMPVWLMAIALGVVAALVHLPIQEQRSIRVQPVSQ